MAGTALSGIGIPDARWPKLRKGGVEETPSHRESVKHGG